MPGLCAGVLGMTGAGAGMPMVTAMASKSPPAEAAHKEEAESGKEVSDGIQHCLCAVVFHRYRGADGRASAEGWRVRNLACPGKSRGDCP
jgi:hypothetical protein